MTYQEKRIVTFAFCLAIALLPSLLWAANSATDYSGTPPYVKAGSTPPNILLFYQTGGLLPLHSYSGDGPCSPLTPDNAGNPFQSVNLAWPCVQAFDETKTYVGYSNSLTCYQYSAANGRFEPSSMKTVN